MRELNLTICFFAIFALFFSCSNKSNEKKTADSFDDIVVDDMDNKINDMPMPTSYDIIQLLNKSGAGYIFDITNPPESVENYITYKQKAINLGVYAADLTYAATYQKKDETALYLDNFVQLVGDLEITTLNRAFFEKVQNNLDNKDSLVTIIKNAQENTHKFLTETGKGDLAIYALTGSWVEGMYLVGVTTKFADNKQPLYNIILKYKSSLSDLVSLVEKKKDDENFKELFDTLKEIQELFEKVDNNKLDIKSIELLKDKIVEFRNSIV